MSRPIVRSHWRPLYAAATLESNGEQLRNRIEIAKPVMEARLKELEPNSCPGIEQAELRSALSYLHGVAACLPADQRSRHIVSRVPTRRVSAHTRNQL
jgi:hypothetical protein